MIPHIELTETDVRSLQRTLRSAHHAFENHNVSVVAIPMRPEQIRNYEPPQHQRTFWDRFRRSDRVVYVPTIKVDTDGSR
jgi:hypothetical protein